MLCACTLPATNDSMRKLAVHHFDTLLLVSLFPLLEYNNYIDDSVLDVDGVSRSRETENI